MVFLPKTDLKRFAFLSSSVSTSFTVTSPPPTIPQTLSYIFSFFSPSAKKEIGNAKLLNFFLRDPDTNLPHGVDPI
jgi:hypothetical protein